MRIFISWSGPESHALARILHDWIPMVLPYAKPWMSSENIDKGKRWVPEIADNLQNSSYCIVCVTPDVAQRPWVNFEAGAVSKIVNESHVSPLLLGVSIDELGDVPLGMFHCTVFEKEDVAKLLGSINAASDSSVPSSVLRKALDYTWQKVRRKVESVNLFPNRRAKVSRQDNTPSTADLTLSWLQKDIIALLARRLDSDAWLDEWEVSHEFDQPNVNVRHALNQLVRLHFLDEYVDDNEARSYRLTEMGVECVVSLNLG